MNGVTLSYLGAAVVSLVVVVSKFVLDPEEARETAAEFLQLDEE